MPALAIKKIERVSYVVYNRGKETPSVIRRGVQTIEEAQAIAQAYAKVETGPFAIVETRTVSKVVRVLS
jgi:hypothetical protein